MRESLELIAGEEDIKVQGRQDIDWMGNLASDPTQFLEERPPLENLPAYTS